MPKQGFTFRPSGQLIGPFFEPSGLFSHSFFKRAGLFHSAALSHGAAPRAINHDSNGAKEIRFPVLNSASQPKIGAPGLMLVWPLPLSLARHLHPLFPELQPCLLVDLTRRPFSLIQASLRLKKVSHKISVAHRVQCGGEQKVPNEKSQARRQII
ncbi:hypothetical protein [Bradyrhizobium liaoningense]|uniref:hypothetical protein n=1 Tax=Bradyrhizobium liaoningense TaxID=43992 RepID=UPI001BAD841E|nr:hypothetical protein [Bradyrhizobium liaoningense]MBR0822962.1 hypothetical protein [Bradyrhizobium liaoningense]